MDDRTVTVLSKGRCISESVGDAVIVCDVFATSQGPSGDQILSHTLFQHCQVPALDLALQVHTLLRCIRYDCCFVVKPGWFRRITVAPMVYI